MAEQGYFSHDLHARTDGKLICLQMKEGMAGIGIYWCLVEMLNEDAGYIMLSECERIAFELRTDKETILRVVQSCDLFQNDGEKFWSDSVIRRMNIRLQKSQKARESANLRWVNANALRTQSEGNATHNTLPITQNPIPITQVNTNICPPDGELVDKLPACQHQEVIDLYHKQLPTLRRVEVWNAGRQGYLRQRWREVALELGKQQPTTASAVLDWFNDFFGHINKSKFLTGKVNSNDRRAFAADLEWILKPSNFAKIVEGKYHGTN